MKADAELLDECGRRGIALSAVGDTVRYKPKNAMTPALLAALTESKAEILEILRDREGARRAPWPPRIDQLLAEGRALDQAGETADSARANAIVGELAAYVASLPAGRQAEAARRLVAALNGNGARDRD